MPKLGGAQFQLLADRTAEIDSLEMKLRNVQTRIVDLESSMENKVDLHILIMIMIMILTMTTTMIMIMIMIIILLLITIIIMMMMMIIIMIIIIICEV